MQDDELKALWRTQSIGAVPPLPDEQQTAAMRTRMIKFDKSIQWRDYREVVAAIVVGVFFTWDLIFRNNSALTQAGCVVLIMSAIFIGWKLITSKPRLPKSEPNAPVFDALKVEMQKVENQITLLKSIGWWYLLPLFVGIMLHHWGSSASFSSKLGYSAFVLVLYVFIYWLNQRAVKKNLLPLKQGLESLLHSLETGEPFDETHIANLPPAARLLIATDRAEPVEFKVAFWQIALWGEIGFIGIWFFLMVGLSLNNQDWKTNEQPGETLVQSVRTEEADRYSNVARKVIDLINAGDYVAVQNLYNPGMGKAFTPKETSDFYTGLVAQFGRIEKLDGPTGDGHDGWIAFRLHCQRGELTMSLALDADDKISGIHFRPTSKPFPNIGSLVRQIFRWQHLIWIAPFFLGGLLFSRMLQKTTERAVEISALGVHLCKGQILVLWDEIKEVRPFRLLNIRSLWLIRESGEKTLMPWTSLERHSDLKAAVERSAPANHPIRQHLSLLKPEPPGKNMWTKIIVIVSVLLATLITILLAFSFVRAQMNPEGVLRVPEFEDVSAFAESDIARIDGWLQEQVALANYPSLSVAIVRDDKIVYQNAFGFENVKAGRKATLETSYHVASVTKVFTTSLAVMLHARGVIDLDQPAVKYLPEDISISTKSQVGATITLRQLASHTSGLPRGIPGAVQSVEGRYQLEPERLYKLLARAKLEFDPGTDELYSNLGMGLLGHVLERAAGRPYDQLLQEMLCEPLRLERTAIHVNDKLHVATGYSGGVLQFEEGHSYRERLAPSGGLIASAPDLAHFLSAQMKPGFFSSEMLEQLHTPTKLSDDSMARTALGWSVRSNEFAGRILKKNGGRNNCTAWIGFAPDHGVGVVVVANCGEPDVDQIGYWLLERSIPGGTRRTAKQSDLNVSSNPGIRGEDNRATPVHYPDPTQMLESIRVKHQFPALAAAVVVDGKIVATNAVGFRRQGGTEVVTANDKFHIGSVTKSMTATVAAMLVEQGKISWTTTIGESFPEHRTELHPDYRDVTLEQLLAHRGGAPGNAPRDLWSKAWNASGSPAEQRRDFVNGILARKPEAKPGTKHIYSNQGYAIAGVMLEQATGKPWEELMRATLFEPLGMNSAGFGAPATLGKVDHPWGHTKGALSGFEPVPPGLRADNPAAIGPAGTVHCSLADLAKYAAFHLTGEQGASELLKPASFKKLHTSAGDNYALGWIVLERKWAGGRALMHNGSNTMFYVVVWMAPERNCAVIVATNVGVDAAFSGCDEAASNLIKQFFPK